MKSVILILVLVICSLSWAQDNYQILVSDDAYVMGGTNADFTWGVDDSVKLRIRAPFNGDINYTRYVYWKFDLSEVTGQIDSAYFTFTPFQNVPQSAGTRAMFYLISDDSWNEETITWNNQPTLPEVGTHFYFLMIPVKNTSDPNITWKVPVTEQARQELAGDKMLTVMVRDDSLKDADCRIYSKENPDALEEEKPWLYVFTSAAEPEGDVYEPTDDAYTRGGQYSSNTYGVEDSTIIRIRAPQSGSLDFIRYIYLRFDLSNVTGPVPSAKLRFSPDQAVSSMRDRMDFYTISDDSWTEETICWDNQPAAGDWIDSLLIPRKVKADPVVAHYVDVTDYVNAELSGDKIVSIMIRDDSLAEANMLVFSKENPDVQASEKPALVIGTGTSVKNLPGEIYPDNFVLKQNYPNPFNPQTMIEYILPRNTFVEINVYNVLGRKIKTLVERQMTAGSHRTVWDGRDASGNAVPSGIYFAHARMAGSSRIIKMALIR